MTMMRQPQMRRKRSKTYTSLTTSHFFVARRHKKKMTKDLHQPYDAIFLSLSVIK
jgi:hypothetical protein